MSDERDDIPFIYRYTRKQAIEDGILIDLDQHPTAEQPDLDDFRSLVREAGIRYPVAMTATAFAQTVRPLDGSELPEGQDVKGRLWDVLTLLRWAIGFATDPHEVRFGVHVWDGQRHRWVDLKAVCGPGDEGEPVLTITLPEED